MIITDLIIQTLDFCNIFFIFFSIFNVAYYQNASNWSKDDCNTKLVYSYGTHRCEYSYSAYTEML